MLVGTVGSARVGMCLFVRTEEGRFERQVFLLASACFCTSKLGSRVRPP